MGRLSVLIFALCPALVAQTVVPITNGGTGAKTAAAALTNLGAAHSFTLTTTGTSGAATYSGNIINIPQYAVPATKTAVSGQPLLSYDSSTGLFTQGALTATNVGLGSVTNDVQTKNSIVPNSFAGLRFGNSGSIDTAATGAQIAAAIGSTAVTNATNATNATSATSATNATNVSNTGAVTTNASYYPCLLAANTTSNQPCNTPTNIIINPSVPSITTPSSTGFRIWAGSTNSLLLGAGADAVAIGGAGNLSMLGGSVLPNTNGTGAMGGVGHDWQNVFTQNIEQVNDIASIYYVTANFTTAANTSLQTITGLTWTLIASTAQKVPFRCHLAYSQATAAVAVAFGIQAATIAPNQIFATGEQHTSATAVTAGVLASLTTTTATNIVSATPAAIATNNVVTLDGEIDNPSNVSANVINIMVSTATSGDVVTVLKGSFCRIN